MRITSRAGALLSLFLIPGTSPGVVPEPLVGMQDGAYAMIVDKEAHRLSLYRCTSGRPSLVSTFDVTTGQGVGNKSREGDLKTPEGVYFFTRFIDDAHLPAEYGTGAIVMDYPNPVDLAQGKGGDGIWLHATNEPQRISQPYSTRGCVVVRNDHFNTLKRSVVLHYTPIIVTRAARSVAEQQIAADRAEFESLVERWRSAWERADLGSYLSFYDRRFMGRGMTLTKYAAYKRDVFSRSRDIRVGISDLQLYRVGPLMVAHFFQDFKSSLMSSRGGKTLHFAQSDGAWRIVGESLDPLSVFKDYPSVLARALPPMPDQPASAPVVAPVAVAAASAPPAEPILLGVDARVVSIGALRAEFPSPRVMEVSFELRNSSPSGEKVTGHLSVLVNMQHDGLRREMSYPPTVAGTVRGRDAGMPGEYFSIRRFKVVKASISLPPAGSVMPEAVKVRVYDQSGRALLIKDYPLNGLRGLGETRAAASLSWKGKN